jgi:NAD(P)-dependent dehydrogenase (short-subunit alcohol dehydrogenase family)
MARTFQHALVIGASSGIGEAIARRLVADGGRVALVARRAEELDRVAADLDGDGGEPRVLVYPHDVRSTDEIPALLQRIACELGGLDLVVFAAGIMPEVAFEEYDAEVDLEILRVNLLGAVAWLDPVAERFGRLGRGTIVGIGSVAGDRGRSGNPAYCTSKAGLHTFLEALRNRIGRTGVKVVTIKPGFVDTAMTRGKSGLFWVISADRAAEIILRKARRGAVAAYVPARWRLVMGIIRRIPSFVFRRLRI